MPTTTRQLSKIAKVSEQTVRNYSREYRDLFTPAARGEDGPRVFSDEDVQVFCSIASLRREGVPPAEVVERLQRGDVYIEATPNSPQATPTPQEATPALMLALSGVLARLDALERNQELIRRNDKLEGAMWGIVVGLAVAALYWWTLYLSGG